MDWGDCLTGMQHIGIPTNDLALTVDFYQTLGFQKIYQSVIEGTGEDVVFLRLKDVMIETYQNHAAKMESGAIDHIALDVKDIDTAYQYIKSKNLKIEGEEIQFLPFWEKGVRFFTVVGPNEERIEFNQRLL